MPNDDIILLEQLKENCFLFQNLNLNLISCIYASVSRLINTDTYVGITTTAITTRKIHMKVI